MPICTREGFETSPKNPNETFHDNELVFYCETTKQIFKDYEDYFRHVMLINSTIWQCEETGKENLTYAEALYSEKKARKKIETFKEILRAPTLIAIARASQSSFKEINNIVYNLLRDRFFRGELIQASISTSANTYHECRIIDIIKPTDAQDNQVIDPNKVAYKLQKTTGTQLESIFMVPPQNIRRNRSDFSQGNLQLFIKDSVHRVQGIIKPKPEHFKKYVSDKNVNWNKLFVGGLPDWVPAKPKKEPSIKKNDKIKKDVENGFNKDKKQSSISKYVVKSDEVDPVEKLKQEQTLREQMERLRKEKEDKAAELERKRLELFTRVEAEVNRILIRGDDLEREDQKLMPKYRPVRSIVPIKYFGDLLYCKEFLHSYGGILTLTEAFKPHITFHEITRAFTSREVAGPLADILICLLGSIFSLQGEEEEEQSVEYQKPRIHLDNEPYITIRHATETHFYVKKSFQQKLNDLPVDSQTLSEVLRLHLLASGAGVDEKAERWRFMYRNGYSIMEDPGLELRRAQPHILRALRNYTVYQLPICDIIKIVHCLISQILTYSSTLNVIDERMENIVKARSKIRVLLANENKRLNIITAEKKKIQQTFQLECFEQKENPEFQANKQSKQEDVQKQFEVIDAKSLKEKQKFDIELSNEYSSIFNFMVYLGSDRAYRKYYVLESIAGIFVEHPLECNDHCLKNPPKNWPLLLNAPKSKKDLRNFLTQYYTKLEKAQNVKIVKNVKKEVNDLEADKENLENLQNGKINGLPNGEVKLNLASELPTGSTTQLANGDIKIENEEQSEPTQYDLYMCSGNPKHCIVHDEKNPDRLRWSYFYKEEEFDALVECLNPLADRESHLKEQLITYKPFLIKHIKKCPVEYLDVEEDSTRFARFKTQMINETNRKYSNSNFGVPINSDINEVMYNALLERIMQFEVDITTGCLGKMKVNNLQKWRQDLANKQYDSQNELVWGPDESISKKGDDPGDNLGDTMEIESEDSSDEGICNYESPELIILVKNFASALLQIGQSIEQKFFKAPFGLQKEIRDKDERKNHLDKATLKLKHWEKSLMNAASYSSVFLHLNVLHDSIRWNRSTNRSNCILCRRRGDAEKLLLCDECNAGTHMFCLKPKLKKIPEANWYCKRCVTTYGYKNVTDEESKKRGRKRKQFMPQLNDEDEDDTKSNSSKGSKKNGKGKRNYTDSEDEEFLPEKDRKQKKIDDLFRKSKKATQVFSENEEDEEDENDDSVEEVEIENESNDENIEETNGNEDNEQSEQSDNNEAESEDNEDNEESEDEEACNVCSYDGIEITCGGCSKQFHLDCVGLKRNPRGQWKCTKCKEKDDKKKKAQERVYESDSSESSSDDEPLLKRQKKNATEKNKKSQNNSSNNNIRSSTRYSGKTSKEEDIKLTRRARRTGENLPLNSVVLYDLLDDISKNENSWPFLRPVLQSEVPDYYEIIKRPMDFAKIKSKLNMGQYRINEEVLNDIQLVFKNCDAYNTEGNEIYVAGATLERFIMARCKELTLPFKPSDMNSS